jgi:16S rRNA (cytidine1402-2'-O)-methyltransferase
MKKGILYLIPSPLSESRVDEVIPAGTLQLIQRLDCFIVEEVRTARRFLRKAGVTRDLDEIRFIIFNEHSPPPTYDEYLSSTGEGSDTGLLSEAGAPCIADPGSAIVRLAHENGIQVKPLSGPSSILLSLMASGFNGQNFAFAGYLPVDKHMRNQRLKELEKLAMDQEQTQIFIETPYRNTQLFQAILQSCREDTMLGLGIGLGSTREKILVYSVREWKKINPGLGKTPAVFLLYHY